MPKDDNNNLPDGIAENIPMGWRITRSQYVFCNIIKHISPRLYLLFMYTLNRTPSKTDQDNTGWNKNKPDYITKQEFNEFKQTVLAYIERQEEFNKQQLEFNKAILARLDKIDSRIDNLVKKNDLKE